MPIYEYHCENCGKNFECLIIGADDPADCPTCGSNRAKRLMSACGFVSKGAGGQTLSSSAGSGCSGCAATNCGSCGH